MKVAQGLFSLSWVSGGWEVAGETYWHVLFQPTNNVQHISKLPPSPLSLAPPPILPLYAVCVLLCHLQPTLPQAIEHSGEAAVG